MSKTGIRALAGLAVWALLTGGILVTAAPATEPQQVGVVSALKGQATVARATHQQVLRLYFKDNVFERDRISTAEKSVVRVLLGGKALVTMGELAVLHIKEDAARSLITLDSGRIAVSVVRHRLRPGEVVEVHTPNAIAAVRGTTFIVDTSPPSDTSPGVTQVQVFNGTVEVSPGDGSAPGVLVSGMQQVNVTGNAAGVVEAISDQGARGRGFDAGSNLAHAEDVLRGLLLKEHGKATGLANAILRIERNRARQEARAAAAEETDSEGTQTEGSEDKPGKGPKREAPDNFRGQSEDHASEAGLLHRNNPFDLANDFHGNGHAWGRVDRTPFGNDGGKSMGCLKGKGKKKGC